METPNIIIQNSKESENNSLTYLKYGGYAVGALLVIGLGYKAYKMFGGGTENLDKTGTSEAPSANDLRIDGKRLTITENDAKIIAGHLYSAMADFGTDAKSIIKNLEKCQTNQDLMLVYEKFGIRRYFMGTYSVFLGSDMNLGGWLNAELGGSDLKKAQEIFNNLGMVL